MQSCLLPPVYCLCADRRRTRTRCECVIKPVLICLGTSPSCAQLWLQSRPSFFEQTRVDGPSTLSRLAPIQANLNRARKFDKGPRSFRARTDAMGFRVRRAVQKVRPLALTWSENGGGACRFLLTATRVVHALTHRIEDGCRAAAKAATLGTGCVATTLIH